MASTVKKKCFWISLIFYSVMFIGTGAQTQNEFACLDTNLNLQCGQNEILIFEAATFGRNSSSVARMCNTRYDLHCSFDVRSELNKQCAGRNRCVLPVNKNTLGDPCGEDEFLRVSYKCINVKLFDHDCSGVVDRGMVKEGYLASPNYPSKYFRGAHCEWSLMVQPTQHILFSILDFDLDVKRPTVCRDFVDISSGRSGYYHECSRQGRQNILVDNYKARISFLSDKQGSPERGFILYYKAIGPACHQIQKIMNGAIVHRIINDKYVANITCEGGYRIEGTDQTEASIYCTGDTWSSHVPNCLPLYAPTIKVSTVSSTRQSGIAATKETKRPPILGLVMGLLGALLLIAILLSVLFYCYRKQRRFRKQAEKNRIQNNLLDDPDEIPEGSHMDRHYGVPAYCTTPTPSEKSYSSYSKKKNRDLDKSARKKLMGDLDGVDIRPYLDNNNPKFDMPIRHSQDELEMASRKRNYEKDISPRKKRNRKDQKNKLNKRNSSCGNFGQNTPLDLPDETMVPKRLDSHGSLHGSRIGVPPATPTKVGESPSIRRYSLSKRRNSYTNSAPDLLSDDLYDSADCLSPPPGQVVVVGLPPVPPRQNFKRNNSMGTPKSATVPGRLMLPQGGYSTQI